MRMQRLLFLGLCALAAIAVPTAVPVAGKTSLPIAHPTVVGRAERMADTRTLSQTQTQTQTQTMAQTTARLVVFNRTGEPATLWETVCRPPVQP